MHRADDVCLAVPWSRHDVIEACDRGVPAHAGRNPSRRRPAAASTSARRASSRLGAISGLRITRPQLTRCCSASRSARSTSSSPARRSSRCRRPARRDRAADPAREPGPALFRQTRYGFNQEPFRIFKFRIDAHDGGRRQSRRGQARRSARHAARRLSAPLQHRRIAATPQRPARRDVDRRPAPARDGARPALFRPAVALCAPPQRQARHHRLGAGPRPSRRNHQRSGRCCRGSSTTSTMSTIGRCGSTSRSCS